MFASNFDASSFISHQYIIAGQAEFGRELSRRHLGLRGRLRRLHQDAHAGAQVPSGNGSSSAGTTTTLGDELDAAGVSWAFYTRNAHGDGGIWSAYQAINHIYNGPDWSKDVITPQTQFFNDVSNGNLRAVSWITPTWENSDHAGCGAQHRPRMGRVARQRDRPVEVLELDRDLYLLGRLRRLVRSRAAGRCVDYDGLGMRIPMLIVSAYAKKGHVSHVHYEHGSILTLRRRPLRLPRLAASDARANSPEKDAFDFKKPPRTFEVIPAKYGKDFFLQQPTSHYPPDTE